MTHSSPPLNPFADPDQKTLQDVLDRLDHVCELASRQLREMKSAIHSASSWLHRSPAEIPANVAFLRKAFARLHPAALNLSQGRFDNVRSLVKRALTEAGLGDGGCYLAPLTHSWQSLKEKIADPYGRESLARFMRYASRQGIEPGDVDDTVVAAFHSALDEEDMTANAYTAAQSAVRQWNRMADTIPGVPARKLSPVRRQERYTLEWGQLPSAFVADADRYLTLQSGEDPTDPLAPPRPLKKLSLKTRKFQIQQLISALHYKSVDVSQFSSLADLCGRDHARLALQYFIERQKLRKGADTELATSMIGGLAHTLHAIAKHYIAAPKEDLVELARLSSRFNRRRAGMPEKNRERLRQLDDPLRRRQLLRFPMEEMARLALKTACTRQDAVRYSVLLSIEILILAPMRIENLAGLDLDLHIGLPRGRKGGAIALAIPRGDVKNEQPLDYRIPAEAAPAFRLYLERFRPLLLSAPSRALFPGHRGKPKRSDTLSKQIGKLLKGELGLDWHSHLFRHLAARINLQANPGDYEGTRRLLGHRSAETTYQIYEGGEMLPAVERYDRLMEEIRGPSFLPKLPSKPRGKPARMGV